MTGRINLSQARILAAGAVTLLLILGASVYGAHAAHAGTNYRDGHCITSYNYADPGSDYLYASTTGKHAFPEPCAWVHVWIKQGGCSGTVLSYEDGAFFVSTNVTVPSLYWVNPCSKHMGEWHIETHWLPFVY